MWIPTPLTIRERWLKLRNLIRRHPPMNPAVNPDWLHPLIDVFVFYPFRENEDLKKLLLTNEIITRKKET